VKVFFCDFVIVRSYPVSCQRFDIQMFKLFFFNISKAKLLFMNLVLINITS